MDDGKQYQEQRIVDAGLGEPGCILLGWANQGAFYCTTRRNPALVVQDEIHSLEEMYRVALGLPSGQLHIFNYETQEFVVTCSAGFFLNDVVVHNGMAIVTDSG